MEPFFTSNFDKVPSSLSVSDLPPVLFTRKRTYWRKFWRLREPRRTAVRTCKPVSYDLTVRIFYRNVLVRDHMDAKWELVDVGTLFAYCIS